MYARDVMTSPVHIIAPDATVAPTRHLMAKHRISRLVIIYGGRPGGVITKKDIGYRMRPDAPKWRRRPVDQIPVGVHATKNPVAVQSDTWTKEIARLFIDRAISSVPVVEEGEIIGIVTKSDLMRSSVFNHVEETVRDIMEDMLVLNWYHPLDHVIEMMNERNDKLVVPHNDGTLAGIIIETNLASLDPVKKSPGSPPKTVKFLRKEEHGGTKLFRYVFRASVIAEDVMPHPAITIRPSAPLSEAVACMEKRRINSLVVVENSSVLEIIKRDDIIKEVAK